MKIDHYSVFAAALGGGKQFAIVEDVTDPAEMQRIAAQSGEPLTGFIVNKDADGVEVRFFSPTKEKGSSDSGALVIAEHLSRSGYIEDYVFVLMPGEELKISYIHGLWWREPETTKRLEPNFQPEALFRALELEASQVLDWGTAGDKKVNAVLQVRDLEYLNSCKPDLEALKAFQTQHGLNGAIIFCQTEQTHLRFFSPAKNIPEDNAGSYTVVSLCGFLAPDLSGAVQLELRQGDAMGKPSRLFAEFHAVDGVAHSVWVGGKVESLEVTEWD